MKIQTRTIILDTALFVFASTVLALGVLASGLVIGGVLAGFIGGAP